MTRSALERAAEHWGGLLGVDPAFVADDNVVIVPSDGDIAVLALGSGCVVSAPVSLHDRLAALPRAVFGDVHALADSFADLGARPFRDVGTASLSYLEERDFVDVAPSRAVRPASPQDIAVVLAQCSADDIDEAAVGRDDSVVVAVTPAGAPAALATTEYWGAHVGHLGVLTAPGCRGSGYATAAAAGATRDVLTRGLLPQWRAAAGHAASLSIARRLGFVALGQQSLVLLTRGPAL